MGKSKVIVSNNKACDFSVKYMCTVWCVKRICMMYYVS